MPTPEHHATAFVQLAGLLTALAAFIFSPITWAGFIGAAFGVAFSEPKNYKEGLLWLTFGLAVSLATNSWLVDKIGSYASGLAFGVAFAVVKFHKVIFEKASDVISRKSDSI